MLGRAWLRSRGLRGHAGAHDKERQHEQARAEPRQRERRGPRGFAGKSGLEGRETHGFAGKSGRGTRGHRGFAGKSGRRPRGRLHDHVDRLGDRACLADAQPEALPGPQPRGLRGGGAGRLHQRQPGLGGVGEGARGEGTRAGDQGRRRPLRGRQLPIGPRADLERLAEKTAGGGRPASLDQLERAGFGDQHVAGPDLAPGAVGQAEHRLGQQHHLGRRQRPVAKEPVEWRRRLVQAGCRPRQGHDRTTVSAQVSTSPVPPSTVTICPSRSRIVASPVPTTAGIPYSRATWDECEATPPVSVTTAAARAKRGVQAGVVAGATRTSPACNLSNSASERTMRAGPLARPELAGTPGRPARSIPGARLASP